MRLTLPSNSFTAIQSGATATVKVATNRRLLGLILSTNATDATQLNNFVREVRLKLGSFPLLTLTIPQLYALLAYYGIPVGAGEIPLFFAKSAARTPTGEEFTAFNTWGLEDLTLEVEFRTNAEYNAATSTSSGFTPTLTGLVEFDFVKDGNRAFIQTVPRLIANSGAGDVDYDSLERDGAYKCVHIFSNLVTRARVYRDGLELVDRTGANIDSLNRRYGLTRQANHFPIDFGYTNQAQDVLEMRVPIPGTDQYKKVETFNLKLTTTAGGALPNGAPVVSTGGYPGAQTAASLGPVVHVARGNAVTDVSVGGKK